MNKIKKKKNAGALSYHNRSCMHMLRRVRAFHGHDRPTGYAKPVFAIEFHI